MSLLSSSSLILLVHHQSPRVFHVAVCVYALYFKCYYWYPQVSELAYRRQAVTRTWNICLGISENHAEDMAAG